MGVNLSKVLAVLQKKGEPEAGAAEIPAPLEDPPTPPAPDPRLPLTAKQLFNISKSWKGIARAMEPTGVIMFVRLFEENEDILHLFEKFQKKRITELHRDSMELAQHASIVMNTLDESIKKLHNVDYFMDYLHAVGKLHTKIPGFQRDYFWRIERPFLAAVQETLGDRYTDNMENIYKITIRYILDTVVKGFDLHSKKPEPSDKVRPPKASPEPSPSPHDDDTSTRPENKTEIQKKTDGLS
ncbi:neuroglobin [Parasteatoda tepidariorum]|uniref:neuroglobin n=1 Tax=Parasteatoda tepidariorum TaxID=114398 RepID=UPI00077F836F|nr:neuroglobin [Parasteatoda tepidariorum]XP_015916913.1 neuroglobin [Parasteatoda tepidariorum]XP_042904043.1 neuroglobin [Parasteatoda tepidariorum]